MEQDQNTSFDFIVETSEDVDFQNLFLDADNLKTSFSTFAFIDMTEVESDVIRDSDLRTDFYANYNYWLSQTNHLSSNNYDNSYFRAIVGLGKVAVPYILEIIETEPNPVVHALDFIYPGIVEYRGYNSLENVCQLWSLIFKQHLLSY